MSSSAIDLLMAEHRLIETGMDRLDELTRSLTQDGNPERAELLALVRFIQEFADKKHHGKEEDMLFVMMVEAGFPRDAGPIAVMLHEHGEGRAHVAALAAVAEASGDWTDAERATVARDASGYTSLLRGHIQKEDNVLYQMALQRLPSQALAQLDSRVEAFEAAWTGITGLPD